jgi:hypothetical protein
MNSQKFVTLTMLVSLATFGVSYQIVGGMKWFPKQNQKVNIKSPSQLSLTTDPFASYNELYPHHNHNDRHSSSVTELQSTQTSLPIITNAPQLSIQEAQDTIETSLLKLAEEVEENDDTFVESLDFAKSVTETTTLVFRGDVAMALGIIFPNIDNLMQFITSNLMHNDMFAQNIIPALALYFGNLLFFIFL